jgi:Zn-dependent protease
MAWQDRDYNQSGGAGDYLSNPAAILGLSVPFGNWFGVRVRLHFWLLLTFAFLLASLFRGTSIVIVVVEMALMLAALLFHDFGHRILAQSVGGQHDEFMLWPIGGMVFPSMPPGAWPMFVGNVGGIVANAILAVGSIILFHLRSGHWFIPALSPLANFDLSMLADAYYFHDLVLICLASFAAINCGLVLGNLLPYYWFDGGYILQSIFWPFLGGRGAVNLTCIIGMILAVPLFALALVHEDFIGLIFWTLLFMSSYSARHTMEAPESYGAAAATGWRSRRWAGAASRRQAVKRRREEQKIDAILAKVSAKGMHSLTWWEKRTLRKGSKSLR